MNQLRQLIASLSVRQRVVIGVAALAVVAGLWWFTQWNNERDFKPLFTNLSAEDAGAVVNRLRESGVEFRLSEGGGSISVPSAKVAEVRLQLASAGLPKSGRIGFELFDKANLGASEFTEQVNFHRAMEGELERSIMAISEVEQARVHVTLAKESVFLESRQPAKASVLLKLRIGAKLSPQNVNAICHLTASAVPSLLPEAVSVVDSDGNLLNRPRRPSGDDGDASDAMLDYRKTVERDLQNKISATLEPILGADKFRVGVSADCDFTSGEQNEEVFDPSKSVMVTSQRTEDGPGIVGSSGVPGTASNLPRPTSTPSKGSGSYVRRTENVAYQSSRTVKRTKIPQGAVKKLSLSVLLDHTLRVEGTGAKARQVVDPPTPEKLKVVRDLVAAAAGFQQDRGDQLVVESFPFTSTRPMEAPQGGPPAAPPDSLPWAPPWMKAILANRNAPVLIGIGAAAMLALFGGLMLLLRRRRSSVELEDSAALSARSQASLEASDLSPEGLQRQIDAKFAEQQNERAKLTAEAVAALQLPKVSTKKTDVLSRHIGEEAKKDPMAMAQIVRSWLNGQDR
ncbi:MAG: flagellar basal-body MS-ring/collar protein FliF [Bryobacteraceae bacterium]